MVVLEEKSWEGLQLILKTASKHACMKSHGDPLNGCWDTKSGGLTDSTAVPRQGLLAAIDIYVNGG